VLVRLLFASLTIVVAVLLLAVFLCFRVLIMELVQLVVLA
jgi:hypothetical protein